MTSIQRLKHLYWRAGFGLTASEYQKRKNWSIQKAVNELFESAKNIKPVIVRSPIENDRPMMMSAETRAKLIEAQRNQKIKDNVVWLKKMASTNAPLLERMTLFWHGHFACEPRMAFLAQTQYNTLQKYALGNFRDLVLAIAKDPAMIRYLNNQQNRKNSPNENFARELLELFTIGRGNYTEQDIKEAARSFTGWSSDLNGNYIFRRFQHDHGLKTFFGKTGNFNGDDIIDIILDRPETAKFITRKVFKYFVHEKIDEEIVDGLALHFYNSGYNISSLMRSIFLSNWFYTPKYIGAKIKSPTDFLVGIIKHLDLSIANGTELIRMQGALGQILFKPPNVAGWPGGKAWIDNSTLLLRLNIPGMIYGASTLPFQFKVELEKEQRENLKKFNVHTNLDSLVNLVAGKNSEESLSILSDLLLQKRPSSSAQKIIRFADRRAERSFAGTLGIRLMSLPEYQLC